MLVFVLNRIYSFWKYLIFIKSGYRISLNTKLYINPRSFIELKFPTRLMRHSQIVLMENSRFIGDSNLCICQGADIILTKEAKLQVMKDVYIGSYSNIRCSGKIIIGNNVRIAQKVSIIDSIYSRSDNKVGDMIPETVIIHDNVWIGAGAIILPNVNIGAGSIVASGSVVTKDVIENTLVAGNPAKFVKYI